MMEINSSHSENNIRVEAFGEKARIKQNKFGVVISIYGFGYGITGFKYIKTK